MIYRMINVFLYARSSGFGTESYGRFLAPSIRIFKAVAPNGNVVCGSLEFDGNAFTYGAVVAE